MSESEATSNNIQTEVKSAAGDINDNQRGSIDHVDDERKECDETIAETKQSNKKDCDTCTVAERSNQSDNESKTAITEDDSNKLQAQTEDDDQRQLLVKVVKLEVSLHPNKGESKEQKLPQELPTQSINYVSKMEVKTTFGKDEQSNNGDCGDNDSVLTTARATEKIEIMIEGTEAPKNPSTQLSPTKSILLHGNSIPRPYPRKSVAFTAPDETVKKFIDGEVIVDKKNPFKSEISSNEAVINKKPIRRVRRTIDRRETFDENDFVSKDEVLRESKCVQTYIKNPDKYFTYDPTVIARIKLEELRELAEKKPMPKLKLSAQTQERLRELKTKCRPSSLLIESKPTGKSKKNPIQDDSKTTRIPTYKRVSKSNYPELSQIKVKTGTDLNESLYDAAEVTMNARKFDDRVRKMHISPDADIDDMDDGLIKSDSSEDNRQIHLAADVVDAPNGKIPAQNDDKKSYTNIVNSKDFKDYLNKKGLVLASKDRKVANGNVSASRPNGKELQSKLSPVVDVEPKKVKKQSVLQRLLPLAIFSSKRKTMPKAPEPAPRTVFLTSPRDESKPTPPKPPVRSSALPVLIANGPNNHVKEYVPDNHIQPKPPQDVYDGIVKPKPRTIYTNALWNAPKPSNGSFDRNNSLRSSVALIGANNSIAPEGYLARTLSVDRQEIRKRNMMPTKPVRNTLTSQRSLPIPQNSRSGSSAINGPGPKRTSTPTNCNEDTYGRLRTNGIQEISPISSTRQPLQTVASNADEWARLREVGSVERKSGKQLFNRDLQYENHMIDAKRNASENIYQRLPETEDKNTSLDEKYALYAQVLTENMGPNRDVQTRTLPSGQKNRNARVIDGNTIQMSTQFSTMPLEPIVRVTNNPQPARCQSALDGRIVPSQPIYGSVSGSPVMMRRKREGSMSREEIRNHLRDFCRRSMNKTPSQLGSTTHLHRDPHRQLSSDILPASYAIFDKPPRHVAKVAAPQVPQRIESLHAPDGLVHIIPTSPLYARVTKRDSFQSNVSYIYDSAGYRRVSSVDTNRTPTLLHRHSFTAASDTDSVFLPSPQPLPIQLQQYRPQHIVVPAGYQIIPNERIPAFQVAKFQDRTGKYVYGRVLPSVYGCGYVQVKSHNPQTLQRRDSVDGRRTPLSIDTQVNPIYWSPSQSSPLPTQVQSYQRNVAYNPTSERICKPRVVK